MTVIAIFYYHSQLFSNPHLENYCCSKTSHQENIQSLVEAQFHTFLTLTLHAGRTDTAEGYTAG